MVELPIPQQQDVVAQAPTNRVTGSQYARSGSYLATGLEKLSEGLNAVAEPLATQQGQQDAEKTVVTRDANGAIQMTPPASGMPILGPAGAQYQHAVAAGELAKADTAVSADVNGARIQFQGNPSGFATWLDSYQKNNAVNNAGNPTGPAMTQRINELGTQTLNGMQLDKAKTDVDSAKAALISTKNDRFNTLAAFAQLGQMDTPEAVKAQADYDSISKTLVGTPAFGITAATQADEDKSAKSMLHGYAVAGQVDRDMQGPGGVLAAKKNLNDALHDPNAGLSVAQIAHLTAVGEARIQFNTGQNESAVAANKENYSAFEMAVKDPKASANLTESNFQQVLDKAQSLGDNETVNKAVALRLVWEHQQATRGQAPNQALNSQGLGTGPNPTLPPPNESTDRLAARIQALRPNLTNEQCVELARKGAGIDLGVQDFRVGVPALSGVPIGTPIMTHLNADGSQSDRYAGGGTGTPGVGRDHMGIYAGRDKDGNMQMWEQYAGSGGPHLQTYIAGDPRGGEHDANNYSSINGPNGQPIGRNNPMAGGRPAEAGDNLGFTPSQYANNPFLLSTAVKAMAQDPDNRVSAGSKLIAAATQSVKGGILPSSDILANITQLARSEPQLQESAMHLAASVQGMALSDQAINLPPGQGQAFVDSVVQKAQGGSLLQSEVALAMKSSYEASTKALKDDPFGTAVARQWDNGKGMPMPLQFDDQLKLATALHQRSDLATSISTRTGDNSGPAIAPNELEQVKGLLESGTAQQKLNLAFAVSTLPQARQQATYKAIGETGGDGRTFAVAGALQAGGQTAVAQEVMAGAQILKDRQEFAPKPEKFNAALSAILPESLLPGARDTLQAGILSVYAKMTADANDVSQVVNPNRMKAAVDKITGGMVKFRSNPLVPPWYGAGQGGMDNALGSVTDDDMKGSVTRDGSPLPAAALRPSVSDNFTWGNFQLENNGAGDGRYRVYSGTGDAKAYLRNENGGIFQLDLGAKQAQVEAAQSAAQAATPAFLSHPLSTGAGMGAPTMGNQMPFGRLSVPRTALAP